MRKISLALALLALTAVAAGQIYTLPVTADVGICAHPKETALNTGGRSRVRVKGNEHYYLFRFDTGKLAGLRVRKATLHVRLAQGKLRRVAFCTVPCEWVEGKAVNKPQNGATCFSHVKYPTHVWPRGGDATPPEGKLHHLGGDMLEATFNSPAMRWAASDVEDAGDGWLEIPIDPELVMACAAGLSHGLVMSDEKGQTRENHDIYTREQANARPYLTVECHGEDAKLPQVIPMNARPLRELFGPNSVAVAMNAGWGKGQGYIGSRITLTAADGSAKHERLALAGPEAVFDRLPAGGEFHGKVETYLGPHLIRYEDPQGKPWVVKAPKAVEMPKAARLHEPNQKESSWGGRTQEYRVTGERGWSWWIVPAGHKADPKLKHPMPALVAAHAPLKPGMAIPSTPRNAWVSVQVLLMPPGGKASDVSIELMELRDARENRRRTFAPLKQIRLYRVWHVPKGKDPHAEVLVPLKPGEKFDIPWAANKVAGQANQAILVDVWVPEYAGPIPYEGALAVWQGGKKVAEAPLAVEVANVTLLDEFHIAADMNTYGSPAGAMGVDGKDRRAFLEMERKYYRLAHAHRMTLNILPYGQSGLPNRPDSAPDIFFTKVPRGELPKHVGGSWEDWIDRHGPLLDGSAFSAKTGYIGPGAGHPIRHMYLPFHENWPAKLADHFRPWPPPGDYDKFLTWSAELPPIERCFDKAVEYKWRTALDGFMELADRLEWRRTRFQVYLNNKYYFRRGKDAGERAYSLWLLDEPMFADDFLALRHFGRITADARNGLKQRSMPAPVDYRIDISRPTHQRDWLDGLVDLNVCAGQLYEQRHLLAHRKRGFGEAYWNYRMPESFGESNLGWALWPVRSFCWGAAGTLPWQTIGSDGDLTKADATALMYPGRKFGLTEPIPSLRMKAWREGLQTAELLRMLKEKNKWTDVQLRAWVGQVCGLEGWQDGFDPAPDAPIVTFRGMTAPRLSALQRAALRELAAGE